MDLVVLIPLIPALGFLILMLFGRGLSRSNVALIGVGSIGASAVCVFGVLCDFLKRFPGHVGFDVRLWDWVPVSSPKFYHLSLNMAFHIDALALAMCVVITFVGALIALFSAQFMESDKSIARYFAVMDLFIASMLVLVLADNLLLLYLGWEGVGLCSFLLIGFWYEDPENVKAANKAFITTRIGDAGLLFAIVLIFFEIGSANLSDIMQLSSVRWTYGSTMAEVIACCLILGAIGKSAQIPLHVWLPDAMRGPTPVSALIHAATMVTAGVYLIARMAPIFMLAPFAQTLVLVIGASTLLLGAFAALAQNDLKRVLAYSTISQIGYMFLALGAGAYGAAIFHFFTHAFFKALLFLGAGCIGYTLHEYNLYKLGGLKKQMPYLFWVFLVGCIGLAGVPLISAGFFSKDLILGSVYSSPLGGLWPWLCGLLGTMLTGFYTMRMLLLGFFGEARSHGYGTLGWAMKLPLLILAIGTVVLGWLQTPEILGGISLWSDWIHMSLPQGYLAGISHDSENLLLTAAVAASCLGIGAGWWRFTGVRRKVVYRIPMLENAFGFDVVYNKLIIKPYQLFAGLLAADPLSDYTRIVPGLFQAGYGAMKKLHTGNLTTYLVYMVLAALLLIKFWVMP